MYVFFYIEIYYKALMQNNQSSIYISSYSSFSDDRDTYSTGYELIQQQKERKEKAFRSRRTPQYKEYELRKSRNRNDWDVLQVNRANKRKQFKQRYDKSQKRKAGQKNIVMDNKNPNAPIIPSLINTEITKMHKFFDDEFFKSF